MSQERKDYLVRLAAYLSSAALQAKHGVKLGNRNYPPRIEDVDDAWLVEAERIDRFIQQRLDAALERVFPGAYCKDQKSTAVN